MDKDKIRDETNEEKFRRRLEQKQERMERYREKRYSREEVLWTCITTIAATLFIAGGFVIGTVEPHKLNPDDILVLWYVVTFCYCCLLALTGKILEDIKKGLITIFIIAPFLFLIIGAVVSEAIYF